MIINRKIIKNQQKNNNKIYKKIKKTNTPK